MNGAVYISFFQGQLESVLEQVVQLAVQEISKTVGSSLNTLLLETAVKEQENRRLRLQLQSREKNGGRGKGTANPNGQGTEPGVPTDTRRLEQRGRVVDQLKAVMEQVLDFAVHELTKIVEASYDDLLLEITKMEREHQEGRRGGRRRGSENDSVSPSGSEDTRDEPADVTAATKRTPETHGESRARPPVLSVSQDWVPILDKVFGQKWCSDLWQIKERGGGGGGGGRAGAGGWSLGASLAPPSLTLEPSPSSPLQDPRWTPLEDMEVFSPDDDAADGQRKRSSGRRSSASMLHRLLTLPSQLLEDDDEDAAAANETLAALAIEGFSDRRDGVEPPADQPGPSPPATREEEEEEEGEEDEDKGRKKKRRRVWSECEECGRRFSRMSLLKAHRQTHGASALHCSHCGKRFSSTTRLHSHIRTQHPGNRS
uniref:C2H2-type domain-containing protein n=1 Tax=Sander lucioperca TaxID=283035 RepID=A0A8C9XKD6_SANLU